MAKKNSIQDSTLNTKQEVVDAIAAGTVDAMDGLKRIEQLTAAEKSTIYCKVSQKGALSVYGLQRMPVTLYVGQWKRVFEAQELIEKFAEDNKSTLSQGKNHKSDETAE